MKKLDYKNLYILAKKYNISVYLLVKRNLNYKKSRSNESCLNCLNLTNIEYKNKKRLQCRAIGENIDPHADISINYICDAYVNEWGLLKNKGAKK